MIRPAFVVFLALTLHPSVAPSAAAPMTVEQRVGQLLGIGFGGTPSARELDLWIGQRTPGLVVLYRSNVHVRKEMADLTARIRRAAPSPELAPLIGIDQEGGTVIRYEPAMLPGAMAFGAVGEPGLARRAGRHVGTLLADAGVDVNLAPVADLSAYPDGSGLGTRSFGSDPERVAEMVSAWVRGLNEAGILAILKHFPGHGFADRDPHDGTAKAVRSARELREADLVPFRAGFAAGADGIMTAHVAYPALEAGTAIPATLSSTVLIDLLREELDFDGLVITDVLHMKGVAGSDPGELAVRALEAGADVVLAPNVREREEVFQAVLEAVRSERLSPDRVEASLRRLAKARSLCAHGPARSEDGLAAEIARRAVTEVGSRRMPGNGTLFVGVDGAIARSFAPERRIVTAFQPSANQIRSAAARAQAAGLGAAGWVAAVQNRSQADLVREVSRRAPGSPLTLVVLGSPYDVVGIEAERTVFAFGFHEASQEAALEVLLGRSCAPGRLPVEVPGFGGIGAGEGECLSSGARESP